MADDVLLFGPTGAPLVERKKPDSFFTTWLSSKLTDEFLHAVPLVTTFDYAVPKERPEMLQAFNLAPVGITFTLEAFIVEQQNLLQQLELHTDRTLSMKRALAEREVTEDHETLLQQIDANGNRIAQSATFYRSNIMFLHGSIQPRQFWSLRELQLPKATAVTRWVNADPSPLETGDEQSDESELLAVARQSLRDWLGASSWGELAELLGMVRQTLHAATDPVRQASGVTVAKILDAYVLFRAFLRNDREERQRWLRNEGVELMRAGGYPAVATAIDEQLSAGVKRYRPGLASIAGEEPPLPVMPIAPSTTRDAKGF
jgi:hypothetical protein